MEGDGAESGAEDSGAGDGGSRGGGRAQGAGGLPPLRGRDLTNTVLRMSSSRAQRAYIVEQADAILTSVDCALGRYATRLGANYLAVELPVRLAGSGNMADCMPEIMKLVFKVVIEAVERAGYRTILALEREPEKNTLILVWMATITVSESKTASKFITERLRATEALPKAIAEICQSLAAGAGRTPAAAATPRKGKKRAAGRVPTQAERDIAAS